MCLSHSLPNPYTIFVQKKAAACIFAVMSRICDEGFYVFNGEGSSVVKRILTVIFLRIKTRMKELGLPVPFVNLALRFRCVWHVPEE